MPTKQGHWSIIQTPHAQAVPAKKNDTDISAANIVVKSILKTDNPAVELLGYPF